MSSNSKKEAAIKIFGMTNQLITEDLSRVAREQSIDIGHTIQGSSSEEQQYYSQFDRAVRIEATEMARHYQIFYCLEKSIRQLISDTLEDSEGPSWWTGSRVTPHLQGEVEKRIKRERDSGMTARSTDPLDFTTFGELSGLITGN